MNIREKWVDDQLSRLGDGIDKETLYHSATFGTFYFVLFGVRWWFAYDYSGDYSETRISTGIVISSSGEDVNDDGVTDLVIDFDPQNYLVHAVPLIKRSVTDASPSSEYYFASNFETWLEDRPPWE